MSFLNKFQIRLEYQNNTKITASNKGAYTLLKNFAKGLATLDPVPLGGDLIVQVGLFSTSDGPIPTSSGRAALKVLNDHFNGAELLGPNNSFMHSPEVAFLYLTAFKLVFCDAPTVEKALWPKRFSALKAFYAMFPQDINAVRATKYLASLLEVTAIPTGIYVPINKTWGKDKWEL